MTYATTTNHVDVETLLFFNLLGRWPFLQDLLQSCYVFHSCVLVFRLRPRCPCPRFLFLCVFFSSQQDGFNVLQNVQTRTRDVRQTAPHYRPRNCGGFATFGTESPAGDAAGSTHVPIIFFPTQSGHPQFATNERCYKTTVLDSIGGH